MTTVLLVEDEPQLRKVTTRLLVAQGYHVEQAVDGLAALDYLRHLGGCDVVVTDLDMPNCDGRELHKRMPEHMQRRVVFYTSRPGALDCYLGPEPCVVVNKGDTAKLYDAIRYVLEVLA